MADLEQQAREFLTAELRAANERRLAGMAEIPGGLDQIATYIALRAIVAALASRDQIRKAGAMLSNCAYNLAQRQHLTDDERRSLDESRQAWDEAISAKGGTK